MSERVSIFLFFLLYVFPALALSQVLLKAFWHRRFLQVAISLRGEHATKAVLSVVQSLVWDLRESLNPYDQHASKILETWYFKAAEVGLLAKSPERHRISAQFLRLFSAKVFSDTVVQTRIWSELVHDLYERISPRSGITSATLGRSAFGRGYEISSSNLVGEDRTEEVVGAYLHDLQEIAELLSARRTASRTKARLLIDDWIEGRRFPLKELGGAYLFHVYMLKYVLTESDPRQLKLVESPARPAMFDSYAQFMVFYIRLFLLSYWNRLCTPVACFAYSVFPPLRGVLSSEGRALASRIVEAGLDRWPEHAFESYCRTIHSGKGGILGARPGTPVRVRRKVVSLARGFHVGKGTRLERAG